MTRSATIELVNRRILLVDDTHAIHQDFIKILQLENGQDLSDIEAMLFGQQLNPPEHQSIAFELDSAFQGEEALDMVKQAVKEQRPYALAFVDVRMPPGWDGIQTIEYLWQVDPALQVVICTAYSDYSWQQTLAKLGTSDQLLILKKPFENIEVLQIANAMVYKWNSTRQANAHLEQLERMVEQRTAKIAEKNDQLEHKICELQQTREQLIQSEKLASIGQLAAGIAHEINNPMGYIHANLDVLSGYVRNIQQLFSAYSQLNQSLDKLPLALTEQLESIKTLSQKLDISYIFDDMPHLIKEALSGADRVKAIVADLKDYSYMSQQEMIDEDINQLIEQAINISKNETKYHISVVKDFANLPLIPCWRSKLIQVLLNLLLNAGQSIKKDGLIRISTQDFAEHIQIIVKDNGEGIAPEHLSKVFDPFFTTKEIGTGTGLGLHICHSIINSHNGKLTATSTLGEGTEFTITLPKSRPL